MEQQKRRKKRSFTVPWDILVIATGCKTNTFGVPGVMEREGKEVFFLKHLHHARQIRNRLLECFERASMPGVSPEERSRLLSFIVVGGGPTSCEFVAELHDFIAQDVNSWYPDLEQYVRVTLVEAGDGLLSSFEQSLSAYVQKSFKKRNIEVRTSTAVTKSWRDLLRLQVRRMTTLECVRRWLNFQTDQKYRLVPWFGVRVSAK